jgi:DNA-binding response OmpR family regulator
MEGSVLFVEDDTDICEIIELYLQGNGMDVDVAHDAETAWQLFGSKEGGYDLLLSDIVLPDMTGKQLAMRVREQSNIPIIFISCQKEARDIIDGLELGADDYITKPFEPDIVVARVKAQLRRYRADAALPGEPAPSERTAALVWRDRRLRIDPSSCEVSVDGHYVTLFAKERQLLLFMAAYPNQVFSVEQLYGQIWGWDKISDQRTVMVHISTLRKKIESDPADPRYIVTVRGFGYKFCWRNE